MKLLNDFFKIAQNAPTGSGFCATIKLCPEHIIYAGHFPGHPVTPGVIQLQIVHELLEDHVGRSLKLISVDECKFLKILNPEDHIEIRIVIEYVAEGPVVKVKATGNSDKDKFLKLRAAYMFN